MKTKNIGLLDKTKQDHNNFLLCFHNMCTKIKQNRNILKISLFISLLYYRENNYKEEVRQKRHLLSWSGHHDIILYNPALQYQHENENNHNHK